MVSEAPFGEITILSAVARVMIDRERRPTFLLDDNGAVIVVNRGVVSLFGWAETEIIGRDWCDLLARPHQRGQTKSRLVAALQGVAAPASTAIECLTRIGEAITLVAELTPVTGHSGRFLLIVVVDVREDQPTMRRPTSQEMYYEIASRRTGDFGSIRHAWGQPGDPAARPGDRCFRVFYKRDSPCPECPVRELDEEGREGISVIARPAPSVTLNVVRANSIDDASVALSVFPVTEGLFSQLLQKKIALLANRGGLSERERSVLDLLLLGRTMENIASVLNISSRTVKYHQRNVQRKLGAESRADLVRLLL